MRLQIPGSFRQTSTDKDDRNIPIFYGGNHDQPIGVARLCLCDWEFAEATVCFDEDRMTEAIHKICENPDNWGYAVNLATGDILSLSVGPQPAQPKYIQTEKLKSIIK